MSKKYRPTAGRAFIQPEQRFEDTGLIAIPEKYKAQKKAVARVTDWSPGIRLRCVCGHIQHLKGNCRACQRPNRDMKALSKVPTAPFAVDITGVRVLYVESAVINIAEELFALPIDDIIAIIADDVDLDRAEDDNGVKRCKFCGPCQPGSPQGMVMDMHNGQNICPRCNKTENGTITD